MRLQSLRCYLASFLFLLMCAQARWPPDRQTEHVPGVRARWETHLSVEFVNYHPSLSSVCLYFDAHNDLEPASDTKQLLRPLAFGVAQQLQVPRGTAVDDEDEGEDSVLFFEYGYMKVSAAVHWCPLTFKLSPDACDEPNCSKRVFYWGHQNHLASDYTPRIILQVNGRLAEMPHQLFRGANLFISNDSPLYCSADVRTITLGHQDFGASLEPTGYNHWEVASPQCSYGKIYISCSIHRQLDSEEPNWGVTPDAESEIFDASVDVTDVMHSICDTGEEASYVQVTIVGLGSERFPFETVVSKQAPSQFTCNRACTASPLEDDGDWWSEETWGEKNMQTALTVGVAIFIVILCLAVSAAVFCLVLRREGTIPAENLERFTSQDRKTVRGMFSSYIDDTTSSSASLAHSSHSLRSTPSMELTSKFKW